MSLVNPKGVNMHSNTLTSVEHSACAGCGTRGNVCRDSDGIARCHECSYAAWRSKSLPTASERIRAAREEG